MQLTVGLHEKTVIAEYVFENSTTPLIVEVMNKTQFQCTLVKLMNYAPTQQFPGICQNISLGSFLNVR